MEEVGNDECDTVSSEVETSQAVYEFNICQMNARNVRQIYLITYSMVDTERFPTRSSFAEAVVQSFADTPAKVLQWCCCLEQHVQSGVHFHMAMKLDKNQRWLPSKRYLLERCGISVHFSDTHENYFSAWKYVTKEDRDYIQSDGAEQAECIFLNDFRWSPAVIQWHDFLLMLEGQLVHLPAPKSHYAKDIVFEKDTPIFATGKNPIIS